MPRDAQCSDKEQMTNISVTSSVIVLLFLHPVEHPLKRHLSQVWSGMQLGIHGNYKLILSF